MWGDKKKTYQRGFLDGLTAAAKAHAEVMCFIISRQPPEQKTQAAQALQGQSDHFATLLNKEARANGGEKGDLIKIVIVQMQKKEGG